MRNLADSKGYTLLEVMVVVAILGIVLVPFSVFFQEYIREISSEDLLNNKQLAQNIMEESLKSKNYTERNTVITLNSRTYIVSCNSSTDDNMLLLTVTSQRKEINGELFVLKRCIYLRNKNEI